MHCRTASYHNGTGNYNTNKQTNDHSHGISRNLEKDGPGTRKRGVSGDNSRNRIKLIWVPSHVGIGGSEAVDQAAKDALNEEIGNQEPYLPQDLMKWMKNEEFNNRQKRLGKW
jgi:hypothetical protein